MKSQYEEQIDFICDNYKRNMEIHINDFVSGIKKDIDESIDKAFETTDKILFFIIAVCLIAGLWIW